MKKLLFSCFLALLLSGIGNNTYANSKITYENQFLNFQSVLIKGIFVQRQDCFKEFHLECPPGSSGMGYTMFKMFDCDTGEPTGGGWYGSGCKNDEEVPEIP